MSTSILPEFIQALDEEIHALKKGKGGSITKVFNGRFLREVSGQFIYLFNLENFLAVLDEAPGEIEIKGQSHAAQVLASQGLAVEIGIDQFCGQSIQEAKLKTNLWYLLELLKKKLGDADGHSTLNFQLSDVLFGARQAEARAVISLADIDCILSENPPNAAQVKAIEASFSKQLSIIWGPPGTGKTATIAKAVEAHLNAGRRVLLVSHANNAVDEALEDIAEHLKPTPFYCEGKLLRLGKPQEDHLRELEQNYKMVLPDKIVQNRGKALLAEKARLEKELGGIENSLACFIDLEEAKAKRVELNMLENSLAEITGKQSNVRNTIFAFQKQLSANQQKLTVARESGTIKRLFFRLDPQSIQQQIAQAAQAIENKLSELKEIVERHSKIQSAFEEKLAETGQAEAKAEQILEKLGISADECDRNKNKLKQAKDHILTKLTDIGSQLNKLEEKVIAEANLVATTLTKTFTAKNFPNTPFDVLIVDEASMAPLPHLYWAAARCKSFVTVVGDFLQLPPICVSDEPMAQKWLGRSIFDVLGIETVDEADSDQRVTLLDTQYRMPPAISDIANRLFYMNKLNNHESTVNRYLNDGVAESATVLIETADMNPWCSRLSNGGRFNLYSALVCASLAKRIVARDPDIRIGIIAPYSAQARLINKITSDWGLSDHLRVSTVHRFQGGQQAIVIFDCVESPGARIAPMLDDTREPHARLLLNVALTRSQNRLYVVGHTGHLRSGLPPSAALARIIDHISENGQTIKSEAFVDNYFVTDFESWADKLMDAPDPITEPGPGALFSETDFWSQFLQDIKNVSERLILLSPFLSIKRSGNFIEYFRAMRQRGIDIKIYSKPVGEQVGQMADQAQTVIEQMRAIGVTVIERQKMHQKIAVLDNKVAWEGSLNILSHRDTGEQMRRFEGKSTIEEIIKNLELDEEMPVGSQTSEVCPNCGAPLVVRTKYGKKFLACSDWPKIDKKGFIKPLGAQPKHRQKIGPR